jgi:histidinol dehydrogenase
MLKIYNNPTITTWDDLCKRPLLEVEDCTAIVNTILNDVQQNGDDALLKYTKQFDSENVTTLQVSSNAILASETKISKELKAAIDHAFDNIYKFHITQIEKENVITTTTGVKCWRKSVAIQNVGLYIPGGTAPLFSTLLMLGVPAKIAGCKNITVCTPANKSGEVNDAILYVAKKIGIQNVFAVGGAQAIAAMAYGTTTIKKVDKIFGPGNQFVTKAKQIVSLQNVAIDMPAGPSEVLVYADETANPSFIAADLLSQAEHGADSQVVLVATYASIIDAVNAELNLQLAKLDRASIAVAALANSKAIICEDVNTAFDFINYYAPEHLIIATNNAEELVNKVVNAGSVFLGHYSPESVGDYASGTNHTLPTNGYAKMYSGVSVDSFVKKITMQQLTKQGLINIANAVETMALAEGLQAHAAAVSIRVKQIQQNEF